MLRRPRFTWDFADDTCQVLARGVPCNWRQSQEILTDDKQRVVIDGGDQGAKEIEKVVAEGEGWRNSVGICARVLQR
ncbi:hypothetical protein GCM10011410_29270 [Hoyosella rhizosphaerae]|uniref:Uncharacterized protein n=1 Tax=Hoyosella rhizosphaerae TaxID=1755582 RepID=A0A916UID7_9ACTN|nr:hypothetical protein GCM10011410_29270 [Hoyosella rhizosphaerae]